MKLQWPSVIQIAIVAASLVGFMTGGHFAAKAVIEGQQSRQLEELTDVALRRSRLRLTLELQLSMSLPGMGH